MNSILRRALHESGWYERRAVDESQWIDLLTAEGFIVHDLARETLAEYGGIRLRPVAGTSRGTLDFDPVDAASGLADEAAMLREDYGEIYFPIGMWSNQYVVYLGESGRVIAMGPGWDWELGASLPEALAFIASGRTDQKCIKVRVPGGRKFPP